ncbi:MAG TPA: hypothetical protein VGH30_05075 [Jatrophihabitantaceae bacterium]|jgi:chromosome segregation ATPase
MTESSDPRAELNELDQRIAELNSNIEQVRADLADGGAIDAEERAAALTNIEELEGALDGLRQRRETVQEQFDS